MSFNQIINNLRSLNNITILSWPSITGINFINKCVMKAPLFLPPLSRLKHLSSLFGVPVSKLSKDLSTKHNKAFYHFDAPNWFVFASTKDIIVPYASSKKYLEKVKPTAHVQMETYENLDEHASNSAHQENDDGA